MSSHGTKYFDSRRFFVYFVTKTTLIKTFSFAMRLKTSFSFKFLELKLSIEFSEILTNVSFVANPIRFAYEFHHYRLIHL